MELIDRVAYYGRTGINLDSKANVYLSEEGIRVVYVIKCDSEEKITLASVGWVQKYERGRLFYEFPNGCKFASIQ